MARAAATVANLKHLANDNCSFGKTVIYMGSNDTQLDLLQTTVDPVVLLKNKATNQTQLIR